jgi:hypothetical protein
MTSQVEEAVNDLKVKMIEASSKVQIVDKVTHKCKNERLASKLFNDLRSKKLLQDYAGKIDDLFEHRMEEIFRGQLQNKVVSEITKEGISHSFKVIRYEGEHYYILTEFILVDENS